MPDLYGIVVSEPPPNWTCLEAIVLVKALNADGNETMFTRYSDSLNDIEALGMLAAAHRQQADTVSEGFVADGDGE